MFSPLLFIKYLFIIIFRIIIIFLFPLNLIIIFLFVLMLLLYFFPVIFFWVIVTIWDLNRIIVNFQIKITGYQWHFG
jgi:hypothetical protein